MTGQLMARAGSRDGHHASVRRLQSAVIPELSHAAPLALAARVLAHVDCPPTLPWRCTCSCGIHHDDPLSTRLAHVHARCSRRRRPRMSPRSRVRPRYLPPPSSSPAYDTTARAAVITSSRLTASTADHVLGACPPRNARAASRRAHAGRWRPLSQQSARDWRHRFSMPFGDETARRRQPRSQRDHLCCGARRPAGCRRWLRTPDQCHPVGETRSGRSCCRLLTLRRTVGRSARAGECRAWRARTGGKGHRGADDPYRHNGVRVRMVPK